MNRTARALTLTVAALILAACGSSEPAGHPGTRDLEGRIGDTSADCDWTHDVDYDEEYTITSCNDGDIVFVLSKDSDSDLLDREADKLRDDYDGGCSVRANNYVGFGTSDQVDVMRDAFNTCIAV